MSTDFETFFADGRETQFDFHGQVETYTLADGSGSKQITIIAGAEGSELMELEDTRQTFRHRTIEVLTSDVARPKRPETITVNGETWTVHAVESIRAGIALVRVVIPVRVPYEGRRIQK